jgi:hypothetical protein
VGEACANNAQCAANNCDRGIGTGNTDVCMPARGAGAIGELCSSDTQCSSGNCDGLYLDAHRQWIPGRCAAKFTLSHSCTTNSHCASGWCDRGNGTGGTDLCMPAPDAGMIGDPCTQHAQCASSSCSAQFDAYHRWTPGVCLAKRALGLPCTSNSECVSNRCDAGFNTANTNVCTPLGGMGKTGEPCTHDTQCASNSCSHVTTGGITTPGVCF